MGEDSKIVGKYGLGQWAWGSGIEANVQVMIDTWCKEHSRYLWTWKTLKDALVTTTEEREKELDDKWPNKGETAGNNKK